MKKYPKYEYNGLICAGCGSCFNSKNRNKRQKYCTKICAANNAPNQGRFESGVASWNKGKNISGMSGKKQTPEHRAAISKANSGENAPNWRGGISSANERLRKSGAYKEWREKVFIRDDYTCKICKVRGEGGNRIIIHADHILPFASFPEHRLDVDNGRTLCIDCHKKTDTYGNGAKNYTGQKAQRA